MSDSSQSGVDPKYLRYWQQAMADQAEARRQAQNVAWQAVEEIAACLRREFGATQVVVFGSILSDRFSDDSDIDLAVEGIPKERYFEAVARVNEVSDRWVDLKPLEDLDTYFRQRVLATGVEIDAED